MRSPFIKLFYVALLLLCIAPAHVLAKVLDEPNVARSPLRSGVSTVVDIPAWHTRTEHLVEFDAPGAATSVSKPCTGNFYAGTTCGTTAFSINDKGISVGTFSDNNVVPHVFARDHEGRFIVFDAPGDGLGHGLNEGTVAYAINDHDSIAGQFEDPNLVFHSFISKRAWHDHGLRRRWRRQGPQSRNARLGCQRAR